MAIAPNRSDTERELQLVCVSHRPEMVERYIGSNPNVNGYPATLYDNRAENIGIAERYNHFIENEMRDGWVIFMHHDMSFDEDPLARISGLPTDSIYGVIGVALVRGPRYIHVGRKDKWKIVIQRGRRCTVRLPGRIKCDTVVSPAKIIGEYALDLPEVDTVDCCCIIVHSSLIRANNLRFDPRFAWHFYSEDFSLNARFQHGIATRVVQIDCGHYGRGDLNADFYETQRDLVKKYAGRLFGSTCYVPPEARGGDQFAQRRGLLLQY